MRRGMILAAAAMALGFGVVIPTEAYQRGKAPPRVMQYPVAIPSKPRFNGTREVQRRSRQLAKGQLRVSA